MSATREAPCIVNFVEVTASIDGTEGKVISVAACGCVKFYSSLFACHGSITFIS